MSPFDARSKTRNLGGEHLSQKDPYLISKTKAKISISLCNIAIDVFISQATWGFRCCCQACSEDKDEPVRLLLAQLQPRLGVMIMRRKRERGLECGWGL